MQIKDGPKPGWFEISEVFEDELKAIQRLPGYAIDKDKGTIAVPHNVVACKPKLFNVELPEVVDLDCEILRPYQKEAAGLVRAREGVLLAMTMGSGKTLAATAAIAYEQDPLPKTLIVGPLMARGAWCGEKSDPSKFFDISTVPLTGVKDAGPEPFFPGIDGTPPASWFFCHYDIIDAWFPFISYNFRPEAIIIDESHLIKNPRSIRSKKLKYLMMLKDVRYRIALSGTPVLNSVMDLWPQLNAVNPAAWGKRHEFGQRYTDVEYTEYGPKYQGQANVDEFQKRLDFVMYRKDRAELLAQLPALTRQSIAATLDEEHREDYDAIFHDVRAYLKETVGNLASGVAGEKLIALTRLCETAGLGKVSTTCNLCESALEGHDKVVIFCWHKSTAREIAKKLKRSKTHNIDVFGPVWGDMKIDKRFETMDYFAASQEKAVFVATIASAGIALNNLVAASCVIFNDLYWLPGPLLQAEARLHRDGQVRGVNAYYVYAENTIDDGMLEAIMVKAESIELAQQGGEATGLADTIASKESEGSALDGLVDDILAMDL